MPVPSLVTDLSTTAASNSPAGSDNVFPSLDDYLRAMSAFIASIRDNSGNGWVSPYLPLAGGTVTGTVTGAKFIPTGTSATGNGMYLPATNTLGFSTNGAETMRLDSSGNLGLGVTPSAWQGSSKAIQMGAYSAFFQDASGYPGLSFNAVQDPTLGWKRLAADVATRYVQHNAEHRWFNAATGSAGTAISFTQAMTLDASGNLSVGTTTSASATLSQTTTKTTFTITPSNSNAGGTTITNSWVSGGQGPLIFADASAERARITSAGDFIHQVNGTAPTLSTNSTMSFELTSNTSLKIVVRGTDGVTRSATLTLA